MAQLVVRLSHAVFATLGEDAIDKILKHIQADEYGAIVIVRHAIEISGDGAKSILLQFDNVAAAEKVAAEEYYMSDILPNVPLPSDNQPIHTELCRADEFPAAQAPRRGDTEQLHLVSSTECEEHGFQVLEVHDYPRGAGDIPDGEELERHFNTSWNAQCLTPSTKIDENFAKTKRFILVFSSADAERILNQPTQYLDEDDSESKIVIRRLSRKVVVSCDKETKPRVVKNYIKSTGTEVDKCEPIPDNKMAFMVTFKTYQDALRFLDLRNVHNISTTVSATVCLCSEGGEDGAYEGLSLASDSSTFQGQPLDESVSGEIEPSQSSLSLDTEFTSSPKKSAIQNKFETPVELDGKPSTIEAKPTMLEVDHLAQEKADDMHDCLLMHFEEKLNKPPPDSKLQHSYDEADLVYRFDMDHSGITNVVSAVSSMSQQLI